MAIALFEERYGDLPGMIATPEGFKVSFALSPESADHLASSLGNATDVPLAAAVN